ncbi:MAG: DegT/DnrJ/EryC1/StrS family aminotransferase [Elusimicrobia bacterium]|nr:DegT/DnrJ/EryC1/StrS family aminotransferase [Candidatus Liberimonas magnetica]
MKIKRISVGDFRIDRDERKAILDVIKGGRISEWHKVNEFERFFAAYIGTKYCVVVSSGTAALLVGLMALFYDEKFPKAKKGAKIITSPVTYASTINAIILAGFEPVFVDIDKRTFKLQVSQIEQVITKEGPSKFAGILPVHLMGYLNDMDEINSIASKYDLFVFEDAAQAHGSIYKGRKAGSLGLLADFSFYIAHNIQAGEMGCVTTNDEKLFKLMRQLKTNGRACNCPICTRNQGVCPGMIKYDSAEDLDPRFTHEYIGYNFKTTEFAPALAISQVNKADEIFKARLRNVMYLNEKLKKYEDILTLPVYDKNVSYLAYPVVIKKNNKGITRKWLRENLEKNGIENRPLFGCMPTQQPAFLYLKSKYEGKLPVAEYIGKNAFYIGCHQYLHTSDLEYIVETFKKLL